MGRPGRISDTVLVVRRGCFVRWCGGAAAVWVLRRPQFRAVLRLWVHRYMCYLLG